MADQAAEPLYDENEHIGWKHAVGGGAIITDVNGTIAAGVAVNGDFMEADEAAAVYAAWHDEELLARVAELEEQLAEPDYEPEPEPEEEAYTDEELRVLEWAAQFEQELEAYEHEHGRAVTGRELNDLMTAHHRAWEVNPETATIWSAALEVRTPDLNTHQGRVDRAGELLEDADREQRGLEYDERGERRAETYPDTNEGRTNLALDMMAGFVDATGQPTDVVPAGDTE